MALFRRDRQPRERRDPTAATGQTAGGGFSLHAVGLAGLGEVDDELKVRKRWLANAYVEAAVRAIAADIGRLKFRAGPDPDQPEAFNTAAPLALLLGPPPHGPNPQTDAKALWRWTTAQRVALGRWAWELELQDDTPVGVWPLVTRHLVPHRAKGGSAWFTHYTYAASGRDLRLELGQVVYGWQPHPDDYRSHYSSLDAAGLSVDVMVDQDRFDLAFIRNDSKPATIVVHEEFATVDDRDAFRNRYEGRHRGPDNAGRTAFIETPPGGLTPDEALKVVTVGASARESQALQRYAAKIRDALVSLGVPMSRLGDSSQRTFSNAAAEERIYWVNTVLPIADEFAAVVNMQLAPRVGDDVGWWDLSEVEALKPVPLLALPTLTEAVKEGIVSRGEARELIGLEAGDLPDEPEPVPPPATPEAAHAPHTPVSRPQPATPPTTIPASVVDTGERLARHVRSVAVKVDALEQGFAAAMQDLFDRQKRAVLDRLQSPSRGRRAHGRGELRAEAVFDENWWRARTAAEVEQLFVQVAAVAGSDVAAQFGLDFDLHAAHVDSFVKVRANQLAFHVTATTYEGVKDALVAGLAEGEGIPELAARIRHLFEQTYAGRAVTVARTEVISAYNGAGRTVALGYGSDVVAGMEWVATRDGRTRPAHVDASGQRVPITGEFMVGGERLAYPGDPNGSAGNVVQCRCTAVFLPPDEFRASERMMPFDTIESRVVDAALGRIGWAEVVA